jgi:hypothetical protein
MKLNQKLLHILPTKKNLQVNSFKLFFLYRGAFSPHSRALCTEIPWSPGFKPGVAKQSLWLHALATSSCRSLPNSIHASKDSSRDLQANCAISYFFYLH